MSFLRQITEFQLSPLIGIDLQIAKAARDNLDLDVDFSLETMSLLFVLMHNKYSKPLRAEINRAEL